MRTLRLAEINLYVCNFLNEAYYVSCPDVVMPGLGSKSVWLQSLFDSKVCFSYPLCSLTWKRLMSIHTSEKIMSPDQRTILLRASCGANVNSFSHLPTPIIIVIQMELTLKLYINRVRLYTEVTQWNSFTSWVGGISHSLGWEVFMNGYEVGYRGWDVVEECPDV